MQGDGHLVLYYDNPPPNTSPTVQWASDVHTPDANTSPNRFEMRNDGNMHLVRKSDGQSLWSSALTGRTNQSYTLEVIQEGTAASGCRFVIYATATGSSSSAIYSRPS